MNDDFKIQSYGLTELAQLYRPNAQPKSALRTLNNWIEKNQELQLALSNTGFDPESVRTLTPMQVAIIVHYLGEP